MPSSHTCSTSGHVKNAGTISHGARATTSGGISRNQLRSSSITMMDFTPCRRDSFFCFSVGAFAGPGWPTCMSDSAAVMDSTVRSSSLWSGARVTWLKVCVSIAFAASASWKSAL